MTIAEVTLPKGSTTARMTRELFILQTAHDVGNLKGWRASNYSK